VKILITGATGFIGVEVTRQLAALPDVQVRALVRRVERAPLVNRFGVDTVFGDLGSPESIDRAVRGMDAVIHLAGRATFEAYDVLAPTIVDGTELVVRASVEHDVSTVVLGSSAFVYGSNDDAVTVQTPVAPAIDYGTAKVDAEGVALAAAEDSSTRIASLRLPHVFGPQSLLFGMIRRRLVPFPGDGSNRFAQLHVHDAAAALIAAVLGGWSGVSPIAADSPTWNTFFDVLAQTAPRVRVVRIPQRLAETGAAAIGPILSRVVPTMVSADTVRGWNLDLAVDAPSVWDELGIRPRFAEVYESVPAALDGSVAFRWRHPLFDFS
jgi:nucleoside-diphosphate-sugar epimerase